VASHVRGDAVRPSERLIAGRTSDAYVSYLRKHNISYIFTGEIDLDISLTLRKLHRSFRIETLMLSGGANTNWYVLQAGLIAELGIIVNPMVEDDGASIDLFEKAQHGSSTGPASFTLKSVGRMRGNCLRLRYLRK
jgi:riboflavin biosynthesis pyrimidine reductase